MRDLSAQVTSSLLRFPGVTIDALGEDEITLDSVLHGKFTVGRCGLAWLSCGPQLEVVHAVTGERLSAYCFSGGGEHLPSVLAARDFSWLKRTGLLIGLEEAQGSMLCLYDLGISRVVKAVVIPGRITAIEPLVSYGGASASTQHLHQSLRWFFGVAAVVTDLGHVFLVDLCLDDLSCSQSELEASDLEVVTKSLAEIPRLREQDTRQGRHLCLQLSAPTGTSATALHYVPRTNQLAVGFSDGYLQLWNMKTLKKEYHSQLEGGRVPVYAFTFQEPENDPRNCCYLWAVQSAQDHEGDVVSLHLLQLAFSERKCLTSGKILYEGLEYCEERYSQELGSTAFPLRAQTTNTRLLSCQTIEKFRHHPDRDDSMNEAASPDTSVSIFSWQVKAYGQCNPTTYIGLFDINRWYHAQMPDSLRTGESLRSCPYLAVWSLDSVVEMTAPCPLLDILVHERSLSRGLPYTCPPPEQFFNPTTYNFDASCLLNTGIVHLTCSGYQKETLSFLKKAAPCSSDAISNGYSRCLMSGLLSARLTDVQPSSLSQEEQLNAILSTAVETSSLGLITGCIKQWTAEEQPGSAVNLRYILEWAWDKVVHTKEELDAICAPLFDSSSNFTDTQTLQQLQHSQRLLANLSTIFHCLLNEAQELTQRGLLGLINKNLVSSLISQYAQVVLWFCRTGLLPEVSGKNMIWGVRMTGLYVHRGKWCADCLMIDGLVAQCGDRLVDLWKRDVGGTGQYPPSSLHALLDIYLLENIDESAKHAIVIYLLLDVMYSFPTKGGPSVESFPTAFAIPFSLVKLVQGLWLLDHHDHQNSLELLLHPTTSHSPFSWQHGRVLQALMCQGQHALALRYLHVVKPPFSSTAQAKLCLSVMLHNRCLVEAWTMLRQHSNRQNSEELLRFLFETCQELSLMKELLVFSVCVCGTGGLQNRELLMVHYLQQANYVPALQLNHTLRMNMVNERDPKLKERSSTRNSILDHYGKVLPRAQRKLAMERAKPYQHPSTVLREVSRPQPLSTIAKRPANENVLTRAAFINNVLSKIEEVWVGKNPTPHSFPLPLSTPTSPQASEVLCPSPPFPPWDTPQAFVGTPITMSSKRKSRLLDLVVRPSSQTSPPEGSRHLLTPPRVASSWNIPSNISKAPELSLLQTPQVVKVRALAASGPGFSAFTPQSILRSSLRPTPVATPSASPRRSITPPPRPKESRITFMEETASPGPDKGPLRWSNGVRHLESTFTFIVQTWPKVMYNVINNEEQSEDEEEEDDDKVTHVNFLPPPACEPLPEKPESESGDSVQEVVVVPVLPSALPRQLSLGLDTSQASIPSVDTTLEFHDAPLPEGLENDHQHANEVADEVVHLKTPAESDADEPPAAANEPPAAADEPPAAANEPAFMSMEERLEEDGKVDEGSVNSQEEVLVVQDPEQELEAMEVSSEQEEHVQSKLTQEEPSPDSEVENEPKLDQEVLEVPSHDPDMGTPQGGLVVERTPEQDKSQPTELIEHMEPLQPVDSMEDVEETQPLKARKPLEAGEHAGEGSTLL
uniref:AT hook containing transcription factor 1 n=1 Tax=Esox lucius TaxID=8010 RepID=A0A6Q2YTQ0_ESOLU